MSINIFSRALSDGSQTPIMTNVKDFGAKGNGTTDDSTAIQKAIDHVASIGGGSVFIPNGIYIVKNNIILRNKVNLLGSKGSSEILFDDSFVGTISPNPNTLYHPAFWNEHNQSTYDKTTADGFVIKDLIFTKSTKNANLKTIIFLRNTNDVTIDGCQFNMTGTVTSIALYAYCCNYNMTLSNNKISNLTGADKGGGFWICNLTGTPNETNKTYNVTIENNDFIIDSGNETLAIYGRDGMIKRVTIINNKFYTIGTVQKSQSKLLSMFGRTSSTGTVGAGIEDIIVSNNIFDVDEIGASVISVGSSYSSTDILKNILIDSNIISFKTELTSSMATGILGYDVGTAENIKVSNNIITNVGKQPCKCGIYKMWDVERNEIRGQYSQANIADCINVINNYLYDNICPGSEAIKNSELISNNIIKNCLRGILINSEGTYNILNNNIHLADDISAIGIYTATSPSVAFIVGNIINTVNKGSVAFQIAIGTIALINNIKFGSGRYLNGSVVLVYSHGNKIDDIGYDTFYPGRILNNEIQDALPVGHITFDTSEVTPAIGWRKKAVGNGADKWQVVKA